MTRGTDSRWTAIASSAGGVCHPRSWPNHSSADDQHQRRGSRSRTARAIPRRPARAADAIQSQAWAAGSDHDQHERIDRGQQDAGEHQAEEARGKTNCALAAGARNRAQHAVATRTASRRRSPGPRSRSRRWCTPVRCGSGGAEIDGSRSPGASVSIHTVSRPTSQVLSRQPSAHMPGASGNRAPARLARSARARTPGWARAAGSTRARAASREPR